MISKKLVINFVVFFVISITILLIFEKDKSTSQSPYWLILAVSLPLILRILFPKLRKLGIGTSDFIPNLMKLINSRFK